MYKVTAPGCGSFGGVVAPDCWCCRLAQRASVVQQGGGAASGGIGAAGAAEVVVGLAGSWQQAWNSAPAIQLWAIMA